MYYCWKKLDKNLIIFTVNTNLPTLIAGGSNMGLNHGQFIRNKSRMTNMFLSIMHSMGISVDQFGDSNGTLTGSIFST